jgi:hypothetical protein
MEFVDRALPFEFSQASPGRNLNLTRAVALLHNNGLVHGEQRVCVQRSPGARRRGVLVFVGRRQR